MLDAERIWRERGLRDAVLAGDESAWRDWYMETYGQLEAYIRWRCANLRDLVEDVLQETWVTVARNLRRFQPETGPFQAWLGGIASNVIRNALRSRNRWSARQRPLNESLVKDTCPGIDARERSERIARALASLPERYEQVLRAKYLDQLSVASIAASCHETEKAIESLLTRARSAFREAFTTEE
jgi:RNA polymerase sigma-70 factor (ECF subfamily)